MYLSIQPTQIHGTGIPIELATPHAYISESSRSHTGLTLLS